jgi:cellulose synthase (UDP-forming)
VLEVLRESPRRSPSAGVSRFIQDETVLVGRARMAFGLLSVAVFAILTIFATLWLSLPGRWEHPIAYVTVTLVLAYLLVVWAVAWLGFERMQRPVHVDPEPGLRVAVVTTFVPNAEPLAMLELTLDAMVAMRYPHDTWVLDEGDDEGVRALCARLGVRHFTRRGNARYQAESGQFAKGTKYGNYNAWLAEFGYDDYDVLAAFDPDHVPESDYLERTLGYLCDPQVGYVQSPQIYYNQEASLIARGAAEESYGYYSVVQMANYSFGEPTVTGCHTVHRLSALRAVGGYPAHDAEDIYLTMLYRAAHWRGIYVAEILAMGTTPVDWRTYLIQQKRWARSLFDLKLHVYPKVMSRLTPAERVIALMHGTYFLRPLLLLPIYALVLFMLLSNHRPAFLGLEALTTLSGLGLMLLAAGRFRQRYFLDPRRERGLHWRAALLQFAKWPYFVLALWEALRGWHGAYDITPKTNSDPHRGSVLVPQIVLAAILCIAAAIGVSRHGPLWPSVVAIAAIFFGLSVGLAWSELLWYPPPFERVRHARRRLELADLFEQRR